jgi:hypothetical protein
MLLLRKSVTEQYAGKAFKLPLPCNFHVADLPPGDLLGLTGVHTAEYKYEPFCGEKGSAAFCKAVCNFFHNSHMPCDILVSPHYASRAENLHSRV